MFNKNLPNFIITYIKSVKQQMEKKKKKRRRSKWQFK
jgi:hypothetical protein